MVSVLSDLRQTKVEDEEDAGNFKESNDFCLTDRQQESE